MIESKYLNQINELLDFLKKTPKEDSNYKTYTSKLAKYRNKLTNEIYKTDVKKNKLNQKIYLINLEIKNFEEDNLLIKDSSSLEKEINYQLEKKQNLEKALEIAKKENKNYDLILSELIIENQKYKKLLKKKNKILKSDLEKNKQIEKNLLIQEKELKKEVENILVLIQNQLNLLDKIDSIFKTKTVEQNDLSFKIENLNIFYGEKQAIFDLNIDFPKNKVIALIGPSGCGKSTLLRTLNRINDKIPGFRVEGKILYENKYDIYKLKSIENKYDKLNINELRTKVGMIFQQPNPFPMSIYKNVAYGPKINGIKNKAILNELVESSLKDAVLWDDVKNNLNVIGTSLSGGQQQRLCIARAIANKPKVLLMDEPTSALDPIAAAKIEELILKLKEEYTIIIVTHSMQQAARVSDYTAFMYSGRLIEYDKTSIFFSNPKEKKTDDYIRGKFG